MQRRSEKALGYTDPIHLKAAKPDTGYLAGYASKFWVVDSYGETVAPGCFQTSIAERGPDGANRIILRHEHGPVVGVATKMAEDAEGLDVEAFVKDDGQGGSALRSHLSDPHPVPYGLSIGFYRIGYRTGTEADPLIWDFAPAWAKKLSPEEITVHTEMKLVEFSAVAFPAVENALVEGYRSLQREHTLQSLLTELKAGRLSDDELDLLKPLVEAWLADGRSNGGETPLETPTTRTVTRRNHAAEYALIEAQLRTQGIVVGAHA